MPTGWLFPPAAVKRRGVELNCKSPMSDKKPLQLGSHVSEESMIRCVCRSRLQAGQRSMLEQLRQVSERVLLEEPSALFADCETHLPSQTFQAQERHQGLRIPFEYTV